MIDNNNQFRARLLDEKRTVKHQLVKEAIINIAGQHLYPSHGRVKEYLGENFKKFQFREFADVWNEEVGKLLND
ncbi:hypothetical protein [Endozoicomonas ascidiicola]|uniref:hypothetical protein n=1 Tax=Endozoicomonas ascidiicola TaxID=1698521 RepID=UPI0012FE4AAA|nr:hypothetical protein [Endozoicomonas ascidiicola]